MFCCDRADDATLTANRGVLVLQIFDDENQGRALSQVWYEHDPGAGTLLLFPYVYRQGPPALWSDFIVKLAAQSERGDGPDFVPTFDAAMSKIINLAYSEQERSNNRRNQNWTKAALRVRVENSRELTLSLPSGEPLTLSFLYRDLGLTVEHK